MKRQSVHFLWNEPQVTNQFASAVSLHSHTDRSQEWLTSVPKYAENNALLRNAVARISSRYRKVIGKELDFQRAYFAPPLGPVAAYRLEAQQIEAMGMSPIVSISDHDTISGPQQLQMFFDPETVPVSLEWTVPFGPSFFHVGIHNLPAERANEIFRCLQKVQCSYCKSAQISCVGAHDARCFPNVRELLDHVSSISGTLIVLNHPLWDVGSLGESHHRHLLSSFLLRHNQWIHALELNGLRTWNENRGVLILADRWGLPVISGGDRHGCEPNAVINLTGARTFSQFVSEVREAEASVVLFLRQYQQPLSFRKLRVAWDVLKPSENLSGVRKWRDRIFLPWVDGRILALSSPEWSGALANEAIERPEATECVPCDALQGTEY